MIRSAFQVLVVLATGAVGLEVAGAVLLGSK